MSENNRRPELSEIAPHAKAYVDLVPGSDVLAALSDQIGKTLALARSVGEDRSSTFRYAPGKWTVKETVGHLADTERILSCRALRLARRDTTALPGFEQDDYVAAASSNERKLEDLLGELQAVRQSTLALLRSLPADAWARRGHISNWDLSVRGIAFTSAGHELHHCKILQEKYLG